MLKMENVNLFKVMEELVEKHVEAYKIDFTHDKEDMLDKEYNLNVFYWILRDHGTELMSDKHIFVEDNYANYRATYFGNQNVLVYKVTITKKGKKSVQGNIEQLDRESFLKMVEENTKKPTGVKRVIFTKGKDDKKNKRNEVDIFYTEQYKDKYNNELYYILDKLKINVEDITASYTNQYFFA